MAKQRFKVHRGKEGDYRTPYRLSPSLPLWGLEGDAYPFVYPFRVRTYVRRA